MMTLDPVTIGKYLANECSPEESRNIEAWINQSDENALAFSRFKKIWNETGTTRPDAEVQDTDVAWQKIKLRMKENILQQPTVIPLAPAKKSISWKYILPRVAAVLIIAFVITFYIINRDGRQHVAQMKEIKTQKGERREVTLSDGTQVWLNAESTLKYPESFDSTREVYISGEAYFKVAHDAAKPFRVHSDELVTEVLGTQFNVMDYPEQDEITVSLDEGRIALSSSKNSEKLVLTPGHKATFVKENGKMQEFENTDKHNEWINNTLHFDNTRLEAVAKALERWYGVNVVIKNPALADCRITVTFSEKKCDDVMEIVGATLSIDVVKRNGTYYFDGQKCE